MQHNPNSVAALVHELAAFAGVEGCSLVEADTGMVWHCAGNLPDIESVSEAAIEFWRIQGRLSAQLSTLGSLKSAAYSFSERVIALFPCSEEPALVLVCVAAKRGMDWNAWSVKVLALRRALVEVNRKPGLLANS